MTWILIILVSLHGVAITTVTGFDSLAACQIAQDRVQLELGRAPDVRTVCVARRND